MVDTVDPATRSRVMGQIRARNTRPEVEMRRLLFQKGFRYRLHKKGLPGRPDVVLPRRKVAIFVHGCFWHGHGCRYSRLPSSNTTFWAEKFQRNNERDHRKVRELRAAGWRVATIWECSITCNRDRTISRLETFLLSTQKQIVIGRRASRLRFDPPASRTKR